MKKIEKLEEITLKHQAHDPTRIKQIIDKVNEIIEELNKQTKEK